MMATRMAVGFAALLALAGCSGSPSSEKETARAPEPARRMEAPEIAGEDVTSGKPIRLSDYRGKVVLVDFWATWCGPCRAAIPHEIELAKRFQGRPFAILGVSADNDRDTLRDYAVLRKLPWPNVFDGPGGPICRDWAIDSLPTFILVDHEGLIQAELAGAEHMKTIDTLVEELVKQAEAATGKGNGAAPE